MNQIETRLQISWRTFWRLALTAFATTSRLALLAISLALMVVPIFGFIASALSPVLLWAGTIVVVLLAARFILVANSILARVSHWQITDFGELVFFDGAEECVDPEEIKEYSCILLRLKQELGLPIRHHVLGIYLIPNGIPFRVASALFRCSFVCLHVPIGNTVPSDSILQQAVPLHLLYRSRCALLPVQKIPHRLFILGQAIIWSAFPRYAHRYSAIASLRSIGMDMRSFHLARAPKGYADLGSILLLAFVAERKGLRNMVECFERARLHEQISLSHVASLFGGVFELERQWSERLNLARSLDPDPEVSDVISLARQLARVGFPNEALQELKKLLAHRPHSVPLLASAAQYAARLRDVHECLALVTMLKPLVQSACCRARLQLAEGLLYRVTEDVSKAQACFQEVLEAESPVTHARTLADRWITNLPSNDWAWVEVQRMLGVML